MGEGSIYIGGKILDSISELSLKAQGQIRVLGS
jgi:hypothetical protein